VYAGPGAAANADYQRYTEFLKISEFAEPRFATPEGRMDNWEEHQRLLRARLLEKGTDEWVETAGKARLTFGHVQTTLELLACPVLNGRGFFGTLPYADSEVRVPVAPYQTRWVQPEPSGAAAAERGA
jgi:crotonobetainyl-CoA:carnitine CoA-transferase CaiB-like acyl-CoA transferase